MQGLPDGAKTLRLTSSACPAGAAVQVQVMVEFVHTDESGFPNRFRLIRSVKETPGLADAVDRSPERVRLLKITERGEEDVQAAEALISKLVPIRLRDVFFTNGDDVQRFISGRISTQQRQEQVHRAIRALLGLDDLRMAVDDIEAARGKFRREAAQSAGTDVERAEGELEKTDQAIGGFRHDQETLQGELANMAEQRDKWQKELGALRGFGDIDELNARILALETDTSTLESGRNSVLARMHDAFRSESLSWALLGEPLNAGYGCLAELADRQVIPGASIEVLTDRLDLALCICGQALHPGSPARATVERLREEQRGVSENRQRLTALFHMARQSKAGHDGRTQEGRDFAAERNRLLSEYTRTMDQLRVKSAELDQTKERRSQIDEARVRDLSQKIANVEAKISERQTRLGWLAAELNLLGEKHAAQTEDLRRIEKAARANRSLVLKRDVAEDLLDLANGTLRVLETDHVRLVSDRMKGLFMAIVGSHEDFEGGVFTGVHLSENFDIIVDTKHDRTIDTDFELNGASQRALTLSFIWALMEVSGTTAPRIIDTPLGMVAGGVKTRMVDAITRPPREALPDFQVILLLTRSEIRDVEDLLDQRAGISTTLSCSKDYPTDLLYPWNVDRPLVQACSCDHRHSCNMCARRYDEQHGISFQA